MKTKIKSYVPVNNVLSIELALTTFCTQNCTYCCAEVPKIDDKFHMAPVLIPHIFKLAQYCIDNDHFGREFTRFVLLGGEPAIYPYLEYLHKGLSDIGVEIMIMSNMSHPEKFDILDVSNTSVVTTYHSGFSDKSFDQWYDDVCKVKDRYKSFGFNILCSHENLEDQIANYNKIKDNEPEALLLPTNEISNDYDLYKQYEHIFSRIPALRGVVTNLDGTVIEGHFDDHYMRNVINPCGMECRPSIYFIDNSGVVYNCANMIHYKPLFELPENDKFNLIGKPIICPLTTCSCGEHNAKYRSV